jgi:hypothetical protein
MRTKAAKEIAHHLGTKYFDANSWVDCLILTAGMSTIKVNISA